jgi:hypothetical protein
MPRFTPDISDRLKQFITDQKVFFVATATKNSTINLSPKGMNSLRVIDSTHVVWLNVTCSGNETSAHIQENPRMALMFTAFEGNPLILRLYGKAQVIHKNDPEWSAYISLFPLIPGAYQLFKLSIELLQTLCGMSIHLMGYQGERDLLNNWATKHGKEGIKEY